MPDQIIIQPPPLTLATGPARAGDGDDRRPRGGSSGELITGDVGARYAEQTVRGNSFAWSTATATSVPALGNNAPSLWNPAGSGVIAVITGIAVQVGAVGTPTVGGLQLGYLANAGSQIGTGSPVLTATFIPGVCTAIGMGAGKGSRTLFAGYSITFTTAPALLCALGLNFGSAPTQGPWQGWIDLEGRVCLYPGGLLQLGASSATVMTENITIHGYEVPLPMHAA